MFLIRVFVISLLCWALNAAADIRALDLSTSFGWEITHVEDDVDRAIANGDTTFFASGTIACSPIGVPPELQYLVTSSHTIYCGCTIQASDDEESARMKIQFDYARAYNAALLRKLSSPNEFVTIEGVIAHLPTLTQVRSAIGSLDQVPGYELQQGGFGNAFDDTPEGREWDKILTAQFGPSLSERYTKIGVVGSSHGSWRYEGARFPSNPRSYSIEIDGHPVKITAVASAPDEAIEGAHIVLAVESADTLGWALLTVTDDASAFSGTIHTAFGNYRLVRSPDYRKSVLIKVHGPTEAASDREIELALSSNPRLVEVEQRHHAVLTAWSPG